MDINLTIAVKDLQDGLGFKLSNRLIILLKKMFLKDGWTKERLFYSIRNILRNYKYTEKHLKPSDFYDNSEIKLFAYSEYLKNIKEFGAAFNDEIEWYKIDGIIFYALKADIKYNLPFERVK